MYGETALTYSLEPGLSLLGFWLVWRARDEPVRRLPLAAAGIGLMGALRPSCEIFLLPLLLVATTRYARQASRPPRPDLVRVAAALALGSAAWLIPLLFLSHGPVAYLLANLQLGTRVSSSSAIWRAGPGALGLNGDAVIQGLSLSLGLYIPLALASVLIERFEGKRSARRDMNREYPLLALVWIAPAIGTYLLVHIGQVAYVLFAVPALLLAAGPALARLARVLAGRRPERVPAIGVALLGGCVMVDLALFLTPMGALAGQVRDRDEHVPAVIAGVRAFSPSDTVVVTDPEGTSSYRLAQYYLPEYDVVALARDSHGFAGELFSNHGPAPGTGWPGSSTPDRSSCPPRATW